MFLHRLSRVPEADVAAMEQELTSDEIDRLSVETDTLYGRIKHLAPVVRLSETPARWALPTAPLGTHEPVWLDYGS